MELAIKADLVLVNVLLDTIKNIIKAHEFVPKIAHNSIFNIPKLTQINVAIAKIWQGIINSLMAKTIFLV